MTSIVDDHALAVTTAAGHLEHIVLLDPRGRPSGTVPKLGAHTEHTPLHLAFSAHLVDAAGRVLLTQRASTKSTWPGVWTNGCCGHPQLGEALGGAVVRRVREELGLHVERFGLALPDFAYRAAMADGTVEHELCPVFVAEVSGTPRPDPAEVAALEWIEWDALRERARTQPASLSPWSVEQVLQVSQRAPEGPLAWLRSRPAAAPPTVLDAPLCPPRHVACSPARRDDALDRVAGPLARVLDEFLAAKAAETLAIDPALAEVVDEIGALVRAGGKRLRPAFTWWGHRATGADADDEVLRPAAAVELLHTFALLHDDVMDRSASRRGRPSAYAALADRHRVERRLGDPEWFGVSAAILAGDLTYVWADELFDATVATPAALARARTVFTTLRREVIAGQYLDLVLAASPQADEEAAARVALLKSARYTVTRPLLLGAALAPAGPDDALTGALTAYGDAVGMAFQMRDDILGLYGDPAVTGKSALDDLREGKRTLLVLRALRLADASQARRLRELLGQPDLDDAAADDAREIVASTGALASVETRLRAEHAAALHAISAVAAPARAALADLADRAIQRLA